MTDAWRFVGSSQWIDGERGRSLRSLYEPTDDEEIVAADLSVMTGRLWALLERRKDGLMWSLSGDQLFQLLMDHIVARKNRSRCHLIGPRRKAGTSAEWSPEDERVWQEWLGSEVLSPERLERLVFGAEPRCWELRLGCNWRREVAAYLPYLVTRSREILREIDPRPIDYEEEMSGVEEDGRRRR